LASRSTKWTHFRLTLAVLDYLDERPDGATFEEMRRGLTAGAPMLGDALARLVLAGDAMPRQVHRARRRPSVVYSAVDRGHPALGETAGCPCCGRDLPRNRFPFSVHKGKLSWSAECAACVKAKAPAPAAPPALVPSEVWAAEAGPGQAGSEREVAEWRARTAELRAELLAAYRDRKLTDKDTRHDSKPRVYLDALPPAAASEVVRRLWDTKHRRLLAERVIVGMPGRASA
jgi:hypothetical protein